MSATSLLVAALLLAQSYIVPGRPRAAAPPSGDPVLRHVECFEHAGTTASPETHTLGTTLLDTAKTALWASYDLDDNTTPQGTAWQIWLSSTTEVSFERNTAGNEPAITFAVCLAEFTSGVSVLRGELTAGSTEATANLGGQVDLTKAYATSSWLHSGTTAGNDDFGRVRIIDHTDPTEDQVGVKVSGGSTFADHRWQVVEIDGATSEQFELDISSGSGSNTATVSAVSSADETTVFWTFTGDGNVNNDDSGLDCDMASTTSVSCSRIATAANLDGNGFAFQWPACTSVQKLSFTFDASASSDILTLSPVVPESGGVIVPGVFQWGRGQSSDATDNLGLGNCRIKLVDTDTDDDYEEAHAIRADSSITTQSCIAWAVDWSGCT